MTMRTALLNAAALMAMTTGVAMAADAAPPAAAASPDTITCGTPIAWDATEESLKAQFGAENVVHKDLGGPEGTELFGTQIYGSDPTKTFDVLWADEEKWANPAAITVNRVWSEDGETATNPVWASAEGVKAGMSIEEVEKINGKPFKLSGFGWDYGGNATSWESGKLEPATDAKCGITMTFGDTSDATPASVLGDTELVSDAKDVRAAKPVVGRYMIYYLRPDPEVTGPSTP